MKQLKQKSKIPTPILSRIPVKEERVHVNVMISDEDFKLIESFCLQQGDRSKILRGIISEWCRKHREKKEDE